MVAKRLDGKLCAESIEQALIVRIEALHGSKIRPHLAVIIVGDDPASHVYVNSKIAACNRLCLLYTSPSPRDLSTSRMPSSA